MGDILSDLVINILSHSRGVHFSRQKVVSLFFSFCLGGSDFNFLVSILSTVFIDCTYFLVEFIWADSS